MDCMMVVKGLYRLLEKWREGWNGSLKQDIMMRDEDAEGDGLVVRFRELGNNWYQSCRGVLYHLFVIPVTVHHGHVTVRYCSLALLEPVFQWCHRSYLLRQKDGEHAALCIDYRELNLRVMERQDISKDCFSYALGHYEFLYLDSSFCVHRERHPRLLQVLKEELMSGTLRMVGIIMDPQRLKLSPNGRDPLLRLRKCEKFSGLAGYYRRFVEGFSRLALPLTSIDGERVCANQEAQKGTHDRLCVPNDQALREKVMTEAHSYPFTIHPGQKLNIRGLVGLLLAVGDFLYHSLCGNGDEISMDFVTGLPTTQKDMMRIWVMVVDRDPTRDHSDFERYVGAGGFGFWTGPGSSRLQIEKVAVAMEEAERGLDSRLKIYTDKSIDVDLDSARFIGLLRFCGSIGEVSYRMASSADSLEESPRELRLPGRTEEESMRASLSSFLLLVRFVVKEGVDFDFLWCFFDYCFASGIRAVNVAGARENVGTPVVQKSGIQCYNCKEYGHTEAGVQLNAGTSLIGGDTDDESEEQELEAHYMYMAQIQEVTPDQVDNSGPIFDDEPMHKSPDDQEKTNDLDSKGIDKLKGEIEDFKTKNKSLESSNNHFKEANNELSKTNQLMFKDLKKFQAELDRYHDVNYASKVAIDCAKAKGDLMSYKMESEKSFNEYTRKINDLNQTISEMKKELFAHQETISIMSQEKEAQIKFYKTREDKEIEKVIALENKVKALDDIVYKTAQSANPSLYDIGFYNDNLSLMLAPESDETIHLAQESRSKLSDLIRPFDYEKLNNLYDLFVPQRENSPEQRYFSERSKMSHTPVKNKNSKESFNKQTTSLEKWMDESILWDQKCKNSKELFKIKSSVDTIFDGVERCKQTIAKRTYKNDKAFKENQSNVFLKEREQYFEIQDLKTQLQDKGIAISELKKLIEKMKGKSMETKFEKSLVIQQPNAFKSQRQPVLGVIPTTSVSRPQLKSNQLEDRIMPNNSQGKKQEVEDHRRNFKFLNNKTFVTACNDSLNAKTLNVNFVCVTCGKCMLNDNHDMYVLHYINGVNSRTKMAIAVPISTREHKQTVNQSIATPLRRTVASESTNQKPRSTIRKLYEHVSKTCSWWYPKFTPSGYKWKPKSLIVNVNTNIILFIVDSGCSKHMTGNLKLLSNFVEKFLGTVKFRNDQIAPILGYGDLVQGNITIKRVYYVEWLNHNSFSVGQFCDADLEVAFRKSFHIKTTPSSKRRLQLLHMDLCGPMRVESINGKKYALVIVDDYSRYTWTHFLRSKDETPEVLIDFLKLVQRGLHAQVRTVRTDKGT
ncbi:retrovirus-related pol polyprotein from transposon TNT 1-94 [Tanacetum coccineum]